MMTENKKDKELVTQIDQIITSNLADCEFDIDQLKTELNIGITKLYAVIRMEYKDTPGKYLLKRRLDEALLLLKKHQLNLTQVARKAGFNDTSYFSTSFKARFGKTPVEFQNDVTFHQ